MARFYGRMEKGVGLMLVVFAFAALGSVLAVSNDSKTLLVIKKSFRDADNVLYDWTDASSADFCSWRGITCDNATFEVIALDLRGNYLSGQIPDEIGDCSSLKHLDLSSNQIYGDIPYSVSKLKQLENLILKNNLLTGPIPSTLSQIPNLKILGLRENRLVGTLSADICQLTGLWYFDVRNNSLTGSIPQNIGNCTTFQVLDLSYNQLVGEIPFNIGFLQVATLSLQGNRLSGEIPSVIGLMQALAVLDLSCNLLTGPIPPILGNLTYTEKLYLHGNKLTGSIPPELGNMTKLHYLELHDNQLSGLVPPELGKLTDLYNLNLANNNLEGPIPGNISFCVNLNSFNVHNNRLNGTIPAAFQRLETMSYLNLSSNNLQGVIPVELSRMGNLDTLKLNRNFLDGQIPAEFGNLRSIMDIDLSTNHLSGSIPRQLGQLQNLISLRLENNNLTGDIFALTGCFSLTFLNVSNNNLVGDIPTSNNFSRFPPSSFLGNPGLCGYWTGSLCHASHSSIRAPISKAAILGIALGSLVILLMILLAACRPYKPQPFSENSESKPVSTNPKLVILHMNMALHVYEDIMRMTENLSEKYIIGYGASSTVYKCVLKNCKPVAIKRMYSHYPQSVKEFETELETVGSIKHRNLVILQGYSLSPYGHLLFYDYMENGSLWDLLHGSSMKKKRLDWLTRLRIALGSAQGLSYLHHDCNPRIVHRDVKSSNILLDKDFEAHLTDFGIAKSLCISKTHTSTYVMGTIGYIDPEYARTSRLTEKSDVYSFGIVLLELLTGMKAVDDDSNLHQLILSKAANNTVMETLDSEISSTCDDLSIVKKVFQLALLCTKKQSSDRPTMHEVARVLGCLANAATYTKEQQQQQQSLTGHVAPQWSTPSTTGYKSYVDEYTNLSKADMLACATSMSTSDGHLFLKFGEVISQNST
ncbi:LRR receptor-like serine/threonine-protein kinase [Nymphaea thermarum]|nr:LRR receptor-like serine/threonine-protein kinase [Nymphaea thermarum]